MAIGIVKYLTQHYLLQFNLQFFFELLDLGDHVAGTLHVLEFALAAAGAGVQPIVISMMERHNPFAAKVCTIKVPHGGGGDYRIIGAIIPTGWNPTMDSARGQWGQFAEAQFQVTE